MLLLLLLCTALQLAGMPGMAILADDILLDAPFIAGEFCIFLFPLAVQAADCSLGWFLCRRHSPGWGRALVTAGFLPALYSGYLLIHLGRAFLSAPEQVSALQWAGSFAFLALWILPVTFSVALLRHKTEDGAQTPGERAKVPFSSVTTVATAMMLTGRDTEH